MLFKIYKKEMIDSFRDKRTLLLTVFLPILMMTALTLFYENMISGEEDEAYTLAVEETLTSSQESLLSGADNVELVAVDNPEQEILDGEAQAAVIFADGFDENLQNGVAGNIEIIGDTYSQSSSSLMYLITNQLTEYQKVITSDRLQEQGVDPSIIQPFVIEQREISAENANIMLLAMLIPMILAVAIGVGAGPSAADMFAGEKERKTMEALLMTPVNRSTLLLAKYLTIASLGSIIGMVTLGVVAVEVAFFTEHLKAAVSFGDNVIQVIGFGILTSIAYAFFVGALLMITSIVGKTVKEAQSYGTPMTMLTIFPIFFISGLGVNEFTTNHFITPFVNIFAIITELVLGIVNLEHILMMLGSNIVCIIIIFIISRVLFSKDKWVMD
ncbi:ABC transporter permease [Ralstonia pickettii]|nr:ABC transporter permease [Ralstonia pickettii]